MGPHSFPLTRCDAFVAGAAAAWLLAQPRGGAWLRRRRVLVAAAAGMGFVAAVVFTRGLSPTSRPTILLGYPAVGIFSAAIVLLASQAERAEVWLRRIAVAGSAAYAVYLVKLPVSYLVRHLLEERTSSAGLGGFLLFAALALVASGLVGGLLFAAVERPLGAAASALFQPGAGLPPAGSGPGPVA